MDYNFLYNKELRLLNLYERVYIPKKACFFKIKVGVGTL
jgi:hypothetical protein